LNFPRGNDISDEGMKYLTSGLKNCKILEVFYLDVSKGMGELTDLSFELLFETLKDKPLRRLKLIFDYHKCGKFTNFALYWLGKLIQQLKLLENLKVHVSRFGGQFFSDVGLCDLYTALKSCKRLEKLELETHPCGTTVTDRPIQLIEEALRSLTKLRKFGINTAYCDEKFNEISMKAVKKLLKQLAMMKLSRIRLQMNVSQHGWNEAEVRNYIKRIFAKEVHPAVSGSMIISSPNMCIELYEMVDSYLGGWFMNLSS